MTAGKAGLGTEWQGRERFGDAGQTGLGIIRRGESSRGLARQARRGWA